MKTNISNKLEEDVFSKIEEIEQKANEHWETFYKRPIDISIGSKDYNLFKKVFQDLNIPPNNNKINTFMGLEVGFVYIKDIAIHVL